MKFEDIILEKKGGIAKVTINRPEKFNAFRVQTMEELISAFQDVSLDPSVQVMVLTGSGTKAFCAGGDSGAMTGRRDMKLSTFAGKMFTELRNVVQPTIAAVNGVAVGGGDILQFLCDLSIASDTARFGQLDPKAGSWGGGFATSYLARVLGEKKAREMWFLCRIYSSQEALEMGLVNKVVAPDKLEEEVNKWCQEILQIGRVPLRVVKAQFNADTDHLAGIESLSRAALRLYMNSEEATAMSSAAFKKEKVDLSKVPFDW